MRPQVSSLFLYPIKACGGIETQELKISEFGPCLEQGILKVFDRAWMFVSPTGEFRSQRTHPILSTVLLRIENQKLIAKVSGKDYEVPDLETIQEKPSAIRMHGKDFQAPVYEGALTDAVSRLINEPVRLAVANSLFSREVMIKNEGQGVQTKWTDSQQYLVISEESLQDLNSKLKTPVGKDRFRGNIWIKGTYPYREDQMTLISTDGFELTPTKTCARCKVITVDQVTGTSTDNEPLVVLAQFRKKENQVYFGNYFKSESIGAVIRVGDVLDAQF